MSETENKKIQQETASEKKGTERHLPAHGPVDADGREVLLSVRDVDITFGKGDRAVHAVKDASFDIYKGETFSLVGESGSGKTTIGRAVIRVNPCAAGEIDYKGVRISGKIPRSLDREVIRNIQMVFQDPAASLNERATVEYIISEGLYNFHLYENEADRVAKVEKMIAEVGLLPEHLTRYPHEFSGGQRQRIGLARAMVMEPELVVADEPISALDVSIRAQVLNLLKKFQEERGTTYLFIAHDLSIVRFISDRIGVIYKGRIVEVAPAEELFDYPLHPYTRSLISAIPIPDPLLEKRKVPVVYDPSVHDYETEQPEMTDIGHGHFVYGSASEIESYKKIRESGVPLKAVTIADGDIPAETTQDDNVAKEEILGTPIHDTGSWWLAVLSFLLPLLGLAAGAVFRTHNYMRNRQVCRKGAFAGLIVRGAALLLFGLLLLLAIV
ncbi:MAG: ABC transporter ATP-binding protein [Clostridia bacterium]|nr:ABC transporter ATP-binding protein [Clostridia bacterium]MBR0537551.1 ABC transporter ATP-binding protein [Clostridia bacterium]